MSFLSSEPDRRLLAPSVARALDDARGLIEAAWDRGERPHYFLCHPALFDLIAESKQRETDAGRPLRLLGLLVVREAGLAADQIDVR